MTIEIEGVGTAGMASARNSPAGGGNRSAGCIRYPPVIPQTQFIQAAPVTVIGIGQPQFAGGAPIKAQTVAPRQRRHVA